MSSPDSAIVSQETLGNAAGPCAMVIFGAGGDLTKRKLIPAIYNLCKGKLLPRASSRYVGVSAEAFTTDVFRTNASKDIQKVRNAAPVEKDSWDWFVKSPLLFPGGFQRPVALYKKLAETPSLKWRRSKPQGGTLLFLSGDQSLPSFPLS